MRKLLIFSLTIVLIMTVLLASQVSAKPNRVTRGDVEAMLQAFFTGGEIVLSHDNNSPLRAAPTSLNGMIRPFLTDGNHYCVDDWHLVVNGAIVWPEYAAQFGLDAREFLDATTILLELDGSPIENTQRTAIKPLLSEDVPDGTISFQVGAIYEPGSISVGQHTVMLHYSEPGWSISWPSPFFMDPSDSVTCTG